MFIFRTIETESFFISIIFVFVVGGSGRSIVSCFLSFSFLFFFFFFGFFLSELLILCAELIGFIIDHTEIEVLEKNCFTHILKEKEYKKKPI